MVAPSTARNREPIHEVLRPRLPERGLVLEIASGAGEHALYHAARLPGLEWRPTDADPDAVASIAAWRAQGRLANLLPPLRLDAADPDHWPVHSADAVVNINMIHISPWAATLGLMTGAGRLLPSGGLLYLYGAYIEPDVQTAASNLAFDRDLKRRNPAWGLRRLEDVVEAAEAHGLRFIERIAMPANNLSVILRKR